MNRSEGDINLTSGRADWLARHVGPETRALLDDDAALFLHQALSTPCLNVVERAEGIYLIDAEGRRIMDFHGNASISSATAIRASSPRSPRRWRHCRSARAATPTAPRSPGAPPRPSSRPAG